MKHLTTLGQDKDTRKKHDKAKGQNSGKKREPMLKKWDKAFVAFAKANGITIPKKSKGKKCGKHSLDILADL